MTVAQIAAQFCPSWPSVRTSATADGRSGFDWPIPFLREAVFRLSRRLPGSESTGPAPGANLAGARAFFTVTALGAIFLDPTEPAKFAGLTYALLAAYAIYWLWIRRTWFPSVRGCFVLHGIDVLWVSVLTTISVGPFSPLFLFFLFVLLAAAYRWGFRGTLVTAIVSIGIFLIESALMAMGPWSRTLDADVPFQLSFVIISGDLSLIDGRAPGYSG